MASAGARTIGSSTSSTGGRATPRSWPKWSTRSTTSSTGSLSRISFLSAAIGQRPWEYLSCCCCSWSPFGLFPHYLKYHKNSGGYQPLTSCSSDHQSTNWASMATCIICKKIQIYPQTYGQFWLTWLFLIGPKHCTYMHVFAPQMALPGFFQRDLLSQWQVDLYSIFSMAGSWSHSCAASQRGATWDTPLTK